MENRLKVLYLITKNDTGGAQKYVSDLAANLNPDRFETKILYGQKDLRRLSNDMKPHLFFINDLLACLELVKTYRREKPQIIHLNSSKTGILGSLSALLYKTLYPKPCTLNPKVVFTAHGWIFNPTNRLNWPERKIYILLHRFAAIFQHKIINVSEYDYDLAAQHKIAPSSKLITIHNGINSKIKFLSKKSARERIINTLYPKPYTLNPKTPWIGALGRLTKEKDYETLIKAAALLPQTYFFIIGMGPEENHLKSAIERLQLQERVLIVPPGSDDAKYLKAFDVFALSSIKEGLPYAILEAAAAKIPIAATDVGGIPEIIKGLLVPPRSPQKLAESIQALLQNKKLAQKLIKENYTNLITKFGLKKMVAETEKIYYQ